MSAIKAQFIPEQFKFKKNTKTNTLILIDVSFYNGVNKSKIKSY